MVRVGVVLWLAPAALLGLLLALRMILDAVEDYVAAKYVAMGIALLEAEANAET